MTINILWDAVRRTARIRPLWGIVLFVCGCGGTEVDNCAIGKDTLMGEIDPGKDVEEILVRVDEYLVGATEYIMEDGSVQLYDATKLNVLSSGTRWKSRAIILFHYHEQKADSFWRKEGTELLLKIGLKNIEIYLDGGMVFSEGLVDVKICSRPQ